MADSGQPPASDPSEHRRAWDAIPWVVAGSAPMTDVDLVTRHLAHCPSCREEFEFQQRLHSRLHEAVPLAADPEPGLQRLLARMATAEPAAASTRIPQAQRWLAVAVVVQAVGLAVLALALLGPARDGDFRTLSAPQAARPASLRLVPAAELDFAALRRLLAEQRLEIVDAAPDGSSLGLAASDGRTDTALAALPRLRSHAGVRMAEPTGHAPR
jgi:hypothetical protein